MRALNISCPYWRIITVQGWIVLLLFLDKTVYGGTIVKNLPGYDGELPFTLETGYVGVGQSEEVQLFYYFVESQTKPSEDPLMVWIPGGPGCAALTAFFFENGPITMDVMNYNWSGLPTLVRNRYAWTKNLNIIFLDAPVGTGFSYSKTLEGYNTSDFKFAANTYEFLQKWFKEHPQFLENPIYLAGDGYSGAPVPITVQYILNGDEPAMNIKGYVLGNPGTDNNIDFNARIIIAHRLALVSDELYYSAYINCNGNFTAENRTEQCSSDLDAINELKANINPTNILQPACGSGIPASSTDAKLARRIPIEKSKHFLTINSVSDDSYKLCADYKQKVCETWANDENVQEALNVTKGTVTSWAYCNNTLNSIYSHEVTSVVNYHQNFTKTNLQALIYSGDHDTGVPYMGTETWIKSLNLTIVEKWRAWSVENETAGYTRRFTENGGYNLTFATIKGAGHYAAEDKIKECSLMVDKWMANISL